MNISKNGEHYSLNLDDIKAIIESNDGHPLHVRKIIGGLEITYNGAIYILQDGQIKAATIPADGRTLPMEFMPVFQKLGGGFQIRQPSTDFTESWENHVNAELKELRHTWEQNEKLNVETAARIDKIERLTELRKKAEEAAASATDIIETLSFIVNGTVKVKLSMESEEIESFLTAHAVNFKRVSGGLELILTPQRVWQIASAWQQYHHERADKVDPHKVQKAILTFCEALEADRGFYDGWKANIAMAFYDEFKRTPYQDGNALTADEWLHRTAKAAAERFLKLLLPPRDGQAKPFPGAQVHAMSGFNPHGYHQPESVMPGTKSDAATGEELYHGKKYWIIPDHDPQLNPSPAQIHALYNGDGIFLYNGREIRMARGSKAETR